MRISRHTERVDMVAGASPRNRSLERGLTILRAFRPGDSFQGNGELAEKTGLPRSTVSRLTQTLVACGFLEHDRNSDGYRLSAILLSLAETTITGSEVLPVAVPLMQQVSEKLNVNVSLAVADGTEMVYLHRVHQRNLLLSRRLTAGHRIPMEISSLGRAYLASLPRKQLGPLMTVFQARNRRRWKIMRREIQAAISQVKREGYCRSDWLPNIAAIATPVELRNKTHVINISVSPPAEKTRISNELVPALLGLSQTLRNTLNSAEKGTSYRL